MEACILSARSAQRLMAQTAVGKLSFLVSSFSYDWSGPIL